MLAANQKGRQSKTSSEADVVENYLSDGELFVISDGNSKPDEDWILDVAYIFHICHNRNLFSTYEVSKGVIVMGNNVLCKV